MNTSLILENMNFAENIAKKYHKKYRYVEFDELKSCAYLGLVEAANKFNISYGVSFRTAVFYRVKGRVIDFVRKETIKKKRGHKC